MRKRATKQQIATTVGMLLALVAAGYWWSEHILWSYVVSRNKLAIAPVKNIAAMPKVKPRSGWFQCQAGAVSFQLPPEMGDEAERAVSKKSSQTLALTTSDHEVNVLIPYEIPADRRIFEILAAKVGMLPIEFIVESYRSGTDDFRWTMTHSQLTRHKFLLQLALRDYPHQDVLFVETWSDDDLDGVLVVHSSKTQAMFEWRLKSGKATGFLRFSAARRELNLDDVRWCCQSVKCDPSLMGPELSNEQLAVLADSMKIELDVLPSQSKSEKSATEE
jgi:hypothetical protein